MSPSRTAGRGIIAGAVGLTAVFIFVTASSGAPAWSFKETAISGGQMAAAVGLSGKIHVMGSRYHVVTHDGMVESSELFVQDANQGGMNFPPAIAVDPNGTVHIMARASSGFSNLTLRYYRLPKSGSMTNYLVGTPANRNYVVGVAATDANNAFMHYTEELRTDRNPSTVTVCTSQRPGRLERWGCVTWVTAR